MDYSRYEPFLPAEYRLDVPVEPESTWWPWRGRRVHIARAGIGSPVRMLALHGAGGHAGLLWPLLAAAVAEGVEVAAVDLPLYGNTVEPAPEAVRYRDWVDLVTDYVAAQTISDDRPLVVFGASIGGMLGYEAAARTGTVAHVVATCLLDPGDPAARRAAARGPILGAAPLPLLGAVGRGCGDIRVPIRWLANMRQMSANPRLARTCATDPRGGGVRVPLGFLTDFLRFRHTPPETFTASPVTLVQPAADRWTPPRLSIRFLDRIAGDTRAVLLPECGHFPVEEPGLGVLAATLRQVLDAVGDRH